MRQLSSTARTAGSVASLWKASAVIAAVRSAHSVATVVAASQAAANCRIGLSRLLLTTPSSHPGAVVTSGVWSALGSLYRSRPRGNLAAGPGEFVPLSRLLNELADIPRAAADTVLGKMYRARQINLIPQSNQLTLTAQDRASALRIGGEDKHLISIEPR